MPDCIPDAFTIGNRKSYDENLSRPGPVKKLGRDESEDYPGGWVWKTREEAQEFLDRMGGVPAGDGNVYEGAVYGLILPNGWDSDVSPEPGDDGIHNLLVDAILIPRTGDP